MDTLFHSEPDAAINARVEKMDDLLQSIKQTLSDIRVSMERTNTLEHRVEELEKTVSRLQSISMDLRNPGTTQSGNDRITPLESMVNKLCMMTAEQKTVIDHLVETQGKSLQGLKREIHQQDDDNEPVIQEIDEIVCGR